MSNDTMKRYREDRIARGECVVCGIALNEENHEDGIVRCRTCEAERRARLAKNRRYLKHGTVETPVPEKQVHPCLVCEWSTFIGNGLGEGTIFCPAVKGTCFKRKEPPI